MSADFLRDPSCTPDEIELRELLGPAARYWDEILEQARTAEPAVAREFLWKYYASNRAWRYLVRQRRRNLVYLVPESMRFTACFAIRDEEIVIARPRPPAAIARLVRESPSFPEGRAVRVTVATARDAQRANQLLALKTSAAEAS